MKKRKGLSQSQKVCIVVLWLVLCFMLFSVPNENTLFQNVFYAVCSAAFIGVGFYIDAKKKGKEK
ncbi:putative membrane-anchored protein [Dysgonomonadaceae bacterium PH5-43]|nr:putative membrane-anchored protein [Dysgonomonadaceae bacterium PH5-43]